jgi:hypothetical protein
MCHTVTFESWCESDYLGFDFDLKILNVASQPFQVEFITTEGVRCRTAAALRAQAVKEMLEGWGQGFAGGSG